MEVNKIISISVTNKQNKKNVSKVTNTLLFYFSTATASNTKLPPPSSTHTSPHNNLPKKSHHVSFSPKKDDMVRVSIVDGDIKKCHLHVTGMTCSSCVALIENKMAKREGKSYIITRGTGMTCSSCVALVSLALAFSENKMAKRESKSYIITRGTGMTCSSCVALSENKMAKKEGKSYISGPITRGGVRVN